LKRPHDSQHVLGISALEQGVAVRVVQAETRVHDAHGGDARPVDALHRQSVLLEPDRQGCRASPHARRWARSASASAGSSRLLRFDATACEQQQDERDGDSTAIHDDPPHWVT
jgi:hypothetical protein